MQPIRADLARLEAENPVVRECFKGWRLGVLSYEGALADAVVCLARINAKLQAELTRHVERQSGHIVVQCQPSAAPTE